MRLLRALAVILACLVLAWLFFPPPETPPTTPEATGGISAPLPPALPEPRRVEVPETSPPEPATGARLRGRPPVGEARNLHVLVVDPGGDAVPRAFLVVERGAGEDWQEWVEDVADGEVQIAGPREGETENLEVREPRDASGAPLALLPRRVEDVAHGREEVVVELTWSRRLTGRVVDTEGEPVAGVGVRAGPPKRFSAGREGVTDADGRFEIVGLPPGALEARLRQDDRVVAAPFSVGPGQDDVTLEVERAVPFTVTVLDDHGLPVPGMRVTTRWDVLGSGREHIGETDAEGRVVVPALPRSARIQVCAEPLGFPPAHPPAWAVEIPAADGAFTLRLAEPAILEGTVTDDHGEPIPSGGVWARPAMPPGVRRFARLQEGRAPIRDGCFRIEGLAPGRYRLWAESLGYAPLAPPVETAAPARDVRLVLQPVVSVHGRVLDAKPGTVVVQWHAEHRYGQVGQVFEDGTFRIDGATEDPGTLYAFHTTNAAVCLIEGVRPSDGPFDVTCVPGKRIAGRVPGYAHRTTKAMPYCVRGPLRIPIGVGEEGTFETQALPEGPWSLQWWLEDLVVGSVEVAAGDVDVVLPLPDEERGGSR